jgi:hypothetical protein
MTVASPLRRRQSHVHGETLASTLSTLCYCFNAAVTLRGSDDILDDSDFLGYLSVQIPMCPLQSKDRHILGCDARPISGVVYQQPA